MKDLSKINKIMEDHNPYPSQEEMAISQTVDFCRYEEKIHQGKGVAHLDSMLEKKIIKQETYDGMKEAVLNPDAPYNINIR